VFVVVAAAVGCFCASFSLTAVNCCYTHHSRPF